MKIQFSRMKVTVAAVSIVGILCASLVWINYQDPHYLFDLESIEDIREVEQVLDLARKVDQAQNSKPSFDLCKPSIATALVNLIRIEGNRNITMGTQLLRAFKKFDTQKNSVDGDPTQTIAINAQIATLDAAVSLLGDRLNHEALDQLRDEDFSVNDARKFVLAELKGAYEKQRQVELREIVVRSPAYGVLNRHDMPPFPEPSWARRSICGVFGKAIADEQLWLDQFQQEASGALRHLADWHAEVRAKESLPLGKEDSLPRLRFQRGPKSYDSGDVAGFRALAKYELRAVMQDSSRVRVFEKERSNGDQEKKLVHYERSIDTGVRVDGLTLIPQSDTAPPKGVQYVWPPKTVSVLSDEFSVFLRELGLPTGFEIRDIRPSKSIDDHRVS